MFPKMQSIWGKETAFPLVKMELICAVIVQARSECLADDLSYFRVNFSPKVLGDRVAARRHKGHFRLCRHGLASERK